MVHQHEFEPKTVDCLKVVDFEAVQRWYRVFGVIISSPMALFDCGHEDFYEKFDISPRFGFLTELRDSPDLPPEFDLFADVVAHLDTEDGILFRKLVDDLCGFMATVDLLTHIFLVYSSYSSPVKCCFVRSLVSSIVLSCWQSVTL
jgi:hypothetical protein